MVVSWKWYECIECADVFRVPADAKKETSFCPYCGEGDITFMGPASHG